MNPATAEHDEDLSVKPETLSWAEEKAQQIKTQCPEPLQKNLADKLDAFKTNSWTESELNLEIKNFEILIEQAIKLGTLLEQFEHHLAQAAQSNATVESEVKLFWADHFDWEMLEPNRFKSIETYLTEQYQKHAKETQLVNDVNNKIKEEIEPEMQSFLPYYFNSKDRAAIYSELSQLKDLKAANTYRLKILKARAKREQFVEKKLAEIKARRHDTAFGRKALKQMQRKCGDGINNLTQVEEVKALLTQIEERDAAVKKKHHLFLDISQQLEESNNEYKAVTGQDHPDYVNKVAQQTGVNIAPDQAANDNQAPEENNQDSTEQAESAEIQKQTLRRLRQQIVDMMAYWSSVDPQLMQDPSFTIKGGNRTKALMKAHPDKLPSEEEYIKMEEASSQSLSRAQDGTNGFFRYRTVDLPSKAEDFTPDRASKLNGRLNEYLKGDRRLFFLTFVGYVDMAASGGSKISTNSMYDYLSHIDHLLNSVGTA